MEALAAHQGHQCNTLDDPQDTQEADMIIKGS